MSNEVLTKVGNKAEWAAGGGGSIPKPLTYDYMPEGYPTKTMETVTVMEQELAFAHVANGIYGAFMDTALDIVVGKTYTVNWDGTEYQCVCVDDGKGNRLIGNTYIMGNGIDTGEPFLYDFDQNAFATLDTSATHTISVKTAEEVITPMAEEFLPPSLAEVVRSGDKEIILSSSTADSTKKFKITVDDSGTISATEVI